MADVKQKQETDIVWADSAQTPDENLALSALANGDGRAGDEHDFGAVWPGLVRITLICTFAVAPTDTECVPVYWSSSHDGTDYDGECTGSDAAYNDEKDARRLWPVGSLPVTNDTGVQQCSWLFTLPARYGLPVVMNASGQAFATDTANHHLIVTPIIGDIN